MIRFFFDIILSGFSELHKLHITDINHERVAAAHFFRSVIATFGGSTGDEKPSVSTKIPTDLSGVGSACVLGVEPPSQYGDMALSENVVCPEKPNG